VHILGILDILKAQLFHAVSGSVAGTTCVNLHSRAN